MEVLRNQTRNSTNCGSLFQGTNHLQVFLCLLLVLERLLAAGAEVALDAQVLKSVQVATALASTLQVAQAASVSGVAGVRHWKLLRKRYFYFGT